MVDGHGHLAALVESQQVARWPASLRAAAYCHRIQAASGLGTSFGRVARLRPRPRFRGSALLASSVAIIASQTMRQVHRTGEKVFVGYSGAKLAYFDADVMTPT